MMYVPVEFAPPKVQKSAMSSLHSSNGKLSNIVPPYLPDRITAR